MFWIHGGGNTSGVKDYYDFSELIREHQVLVVTINYRLGPMGWFTHPAIQGLQNGIDKAKEILADGRASQKLKEYIKISNSYKL